MSILLPAVVDAGLSEIHVYWTSRRCQKRAVFFRDEILISPCCPLPFRFVIFQRFRSSFPTTMSCPCLPAELLDDVVDLLQDRSEALKSCCLVAKSWIPRARRHLFARIALPDVASLRSWKTAFPDPSTSPAYYTRSLLIRYPWDIMVEDVEEGSWIPAFSRVAHFEVVIPTWARSDTDREMSLVPFHAFSPALGSIRVAVANDVPLLHVSNLIHSFSRLQDLAVITDGSFGPSDGPYTQLATTQPPSPLVFTGVLKLSLHIGMNPIASRLLSIPNALHFRELRLAWNQEDDIPLTTALVKRCSPMLENLEMTNLIGATDQRPRFHQ